MQRARLAAEKRNLAATFDGLEDRLVSSRHRVRFWHEMRMRHESVSAIACASQEGHAQEMAKRLLPDEERRVAARRARARTVAFDHAARPPASSTRPAGRAAGERPAAAPAQPQLVPLAPDPAPGPAAAREQEPSRVTGVSQ